jgi:AcrR family transcriptional regulator
MGATTSTAILEAPVDGGMAMEDRREPKTAGMGDSRHFASASAPPPRRPARRKRADLPRVTSEDYFEAAFRILAEHGSEGVTVTNLCDEVGVTKGSFYYHFYNMPEFVEAFVEYWEQGFIEVLSEPLREADPLLQMGGLMTAIANLPHEAEAALRAWGHSNPVIGEAQSRLEQMGEAVVASIVSSFIDDPDTVALVAYQAIALTIGLQHLSKHVDRLRFLRSMANLAELTCGVRAVYTGEPERPSVVFSRV